MRARGGGDGAPRRRRVARRRILCRTRLARRRDAHRVSPRALPRTIPTSASSPVLARALRFRRFRRFHHAPRALRVHSVSTAAPRGAPSPAGGYPNPRSRGACAFSNRAALRGVKTSRHAPGASDAFRLVAEHRAPVVPPPQSSRAGSPAASAPRDARASGEGFCISAVPAASVFRGARRSSATALSLASAHAAAKVSSAAPRMPNHAPTSSNPAGVAVLMSSYRTNRTPSSRDRAKARSARANPLAPLALTSSDGAAPGSMSPRGT